MACVPENAEAVTMQGERADHDNESIHYPMYSGPEFGSASTSSVAATKRRLHRKRFLRKTIVKQQVFQPIEPRIPILLPSLPPQINQWMLRFLFEKQLKNSDVSSAGRIVIPKMKAETYLPTLDAKEGIWMHLNDMDYPQIWSFRFRFWPNNSSRMYLFDNTKDFIKERKLAAGDYIMVFKDETSGSYLVRGMKNDNQEDQFYTNDDSLNANPSTMVENISSLNHGNTNIINDYPMAFHGGVELDNLQLERSASFESLDFSTLFA